MIPAERPGPHDGRGRLELKILIGGSATKDRPPAGKTRSRGPEAPPAPVSTPSDHKIEFASAVSARDDFFK